MNYRGFKIQTNPASQPLTLSAFTMAKLYTEYQVLEATGPDRNWREVGVANDMNIAKELIDRVIAARERFLRDVA